MSSNEARDYYKYLFTPDSESGLFSSSNENSTSVLPDESLTAPANPFAADFLAQGSHILRELYGREWTNVPLPFAENEVTLIDDADICSQSSSSDMDISTISSSDISSLSDAESISHFDDARTNLSTLSNEINTPTEMIHLLKENDIMSLLGQSNPNKIKESKSPTDPPPLADKIGCFNIQNKFDHNTAAEFFVRENMTFLSLQEPYPFGFNNNASWESYQTLELQNARIQCFITKHQIILFDTWKWGGKTMDEFQSHSQGRVTSIAFDLGNSQKVGIISVYASTSEAHKGSQSIHSDDEVFITSADIIDQIKVSWKHRFKDICVIILGDFQETLTVQDRDNMGSCRYEPPPHGILRLLERTHSSIVRESNPNKDYITRIGREGGRGIDHIMVPISPKHRSWFLGAEIDRATGNSYFPSDHSFIFCQFNRQGPNNAVTETEKRKFDYSKLYRIKVSRTGDKGSYLKLDEKQFKDCGKFKEQQKLYDKLQKLTGDKSDTSAYILEDIEKRTKTLFKSLWYSGLGQGVNGPKNNLVKITESQAVEVAHIVKAFNAGVQDVMQSLELFNDSDEKDKADHTRARLNKRLGFKHFGNLPIPTKIRYIRTQLQRKIRLVKEAQQWLKEYDLKSKLKRELPQWSEFIQIIITLNDTSKLAKDSKSLYDSALLEAEERERHVEAISHYKLKKKSNKSDATPNGDKVLPKDQYNANELPHVPEYFVDKINSWLREANCSQLFGTPRTSDILKVLINCLDPWCNLTSSIDIDTKNMDSSSFQEFANEMLQKGSSELLQVSQKVNRIQYEYRKSTLQYFLDVSQISNFTQKVLPKSRAAPTTHTKIWDEGIESFRDCRNENEELQATREFHGRWMDNSKAEEICAFAKVREEGNLGFRGVDLFPDRTVGNSDVSKLVHNGDKLPKKIKEAFLKAHGKHVSRLFQPPEKDCTELFYPFYLLDNKGNMNEDKEITESFFKSIASVPSKARYDGFQLAVLGRFGRRWQLQLLNIIKLILIMRYVPSSLKKIARFPIPKPGKINEYRPISLCNDLYCFLNGIITTYTSAGIERARILHEGLVAYRPGMGCHSLVTIEQCFREDCVEGNWPAVQLDEDEEKFFDRIPVAILLAAMRVNGFPEQGFLEFKASAMGAKEVDIITCKGTTYARFVCGLEQGNPDSPTVANLVIKFKHDVWDVISEEIKKIFDRNKHAHKEKYVFNTIDPLDGQVIICKIGYCDDNSKFIRVENEEDLIKLVHYYLQLAGDLSMVTKIGRKGSKCDIQFFNISADLTIKLRKTMSTAWSFKFDAPIEEEVPFRVCLKPSELIKLKKKIDYENLDELEKNKWDKIVDSEAHRHLGLLGTMSGSTAETSSHFLHKMMNRVNQLKIQNMNNEAQQKCVNMLINTMHSYIPLQASHTVKDLLSFDNYVANLLRRKNGLTITDAKHRLFIPTKFGGEGITSALEVDLLSTTRELEIVSNSSGPDSPAFRTRIAATKNLHTSNAFNHARKAIQKLAHYGIHFRDSSDGLVNDLINHFGKLNKYVSIGHQNYKNGNSHNIGNGKASNTDIAFGSPTHEALMKLKGNNWVINGDIEGLDEQSIVKFEEAIKILPSIKTRKIEDFSRLFECWEWIHPNFADPVHLVPRHSDEWRPIHIKKAIHNAHSDIDWNAPDSSIFRIIEKELSFASGDNFTKPRHCVDINLPINHNHFECIKAILESKSPIIVATDGALRNPNDFKSKSISSAFAICILDIKQSESIESGEWAHRPVIPLLSRCALLPSSIGADDTDIASAECHAFLSQELCIPSYLPRIIITDSEAVREQVLEARNSKEMIIDRKLVRSTIGGIGKSIMGTLASLISRNHIQSSTESACAANPLLMETINTLKARTQEFLKEAESWTINFKEPDQVEADQSEVLQKATTEWRIDYYDNDDSRAVIKVNSHQLDDDGLAIKYNKRYPNLIPNLSMLNANHIADVVAEIPNAVGFHDIKVAEHRMEDTFSPLRFKIMANGLCIDKHVSLKLQQMFTDEKIKRLKTKHTQGLLWRLYDFVDSDWKDINNNRGLRRSLLGLSRTHSRSLYKSGNYREGLYREYLETLVDESDKEKAQKLKLKDKISILCTCKWCPKNSPQALEHGNRMHAFLHCKHKDLRSFRENARKTINSEIVKFINLIEDFTTKAGAVAFLYDVQNVFLNLQHSQAGRLTRVSSSSNKSYATITDLLCKYESSDLFSCLKTEDNLIGLELFGFIPQNTNAYLNDSYIGAMDSPWLGMFPMKLVAAINNIKSVIKINTKHLESRDTIIESFDNKWNLIKGLTLGMAMGLHRVIGTVGKSLEHTLQTKYELDQHTFKAIKAKIHCSGKKVKSHKRSVSPNPATTCIPCEVVSDSNTAASHIKRECAGLTCNANKINWKIFKNFITPNRIPVKNKHCTRCARQSSAVRLAIQIIGEFSKDSTSIQTKQFLTLLQSSSCEKIPYRPLMHLLHKHYSKFRLTNEAKYIRKNILTDANKSVCRAIVQAHILESVPEITTLGKLQGMHKRLQSTLTRSEQEVESGRGTFKQAELALEAILQERKDNQEEPTLSRLDEQQHHHYVREALTSNGLLSSMGIRRAIEVFRNRNVQNCFFANAEARDILEDWNTTQGWERAARMFGSHEVLCNKPDGFYFIPLFEGNERSGHWTVAIIRKLGRHKWGYVCDSLGMSSCSGIIHTKIKELFQGPRDRFDWNECTSRQQSEVECGPRTIIAIHNAIESIGRNDPVETIILKATLMRGLEEEYDAKKIREKAANIISRFLPSMWTGPIRVNRNRTTGREINNTAGDGNEPPRKKRRRRKKQKNSNRASPSSTPITIPSE